MKRLIFYEFSEMETSNPLQLQLNPIYFVTHFTVSNITDFEIYYFIGNTVITYSLISVVLTVIYVSVIRLLTVSSYKKYRLN